MFDGLTHLIHIFFSSLVIFFMLVFFLCFFSFYLIYLIIILFYATLQSGSHPRLLDLVLQTNLLKLGLCKYNVIINIINITLRSGVAAKPKTFRYNFAERPNTIKT